MGATVREITRGKKKSYYVYICHNYHRRAKKCSSKWEAERFANDINREIAKGTFNFTPKQEKTIPTFGEYGQKWLKDFGATKLKYSTLKGYESILRNHLGGLSDKPLDQITRTDIVDILNAKREAGLKPATLKRIKALISGIFSNAIWFDPGKISYNPASQWGRNSPIEADQKFDIDPLNKDEAKLFLDTIQEHFPTYYPFFLCALRTGMRLGELLGLEWRDIDFHGSFIMVRRAYVRGRVTGPKNKKTRKVIMSKHLWETLNALCPASWREAQARWGEENKPVFVNSAGQRLDERNLRQRVLYPALVKCGLRRIRIHDLRHSYATMLIEDNVSLAFVSNQLGHHSIKITVDTYGHIDPRLNQEAIDRLDAELAAKSASDGLRKTVNK
jgi:integrase